jgi:hypothetical protein
MTKPNRSVFVGNAFLLQVIFEILYDNCNLTGFHLPFLFIQPSTVIMLLTARRGG